MRNVYRLLPPRREGLQTVRVNDDVFLDWCYSGTEANVPAAVHGRRHGDDDEEFADYPVSAPYCPALSLRILDQVRERFAPHGYFIPLAVLGAHEQQHEVYFPRHTVDCLDHAASTPPQGVLDEIQTAVFLSDRLPLEAPSFRVPGAPTSVYWNGWAAELLAGLLGPEKLALRLVWSEDPEAEVHPNPMGF
jgi:hypothetical protein